MMLCEKPMEIYKLEFSGGLFCLLQVIFDDKKTAKPR